MAAVTLDKLRKNYGAVEIVKGIDLAIRDQEFLVLVGPSGCGKSTCLRMIAGLESITGGEIRIGERRVNDVPPRGRDIAMVFQDYALYPHKTVAQNMSFGLEAQRLPKDQIATRIKEAADVLGIGHLLDRLPRQLSGGQRQRVAMGRCIVRRPQVFLFDEPLSNLDAKLRGEVRTEIKKLHRRLETTMIYVTHDQVEAMTLADRIVILRAGVIEQAGTPDDVYNTPANLFVASFIGSPTMNFLHARVSLDGNRLVFKDQSDLLAPSAALRRLATLAGRDVVIGIRPENVSAAATECQIAGRVEVVEPLGSDTMVHVTTAGGTIVARMPPGVRMDPGDGVRLGLDPGRMHLFDAATERVLN